jgi:acyl carrier protein
MTRQELVDIVMSGISEQFGVGKQSLSEATVASDVAGWDSFSHGQLLLGIETRLGRPLQLDRLFAVKTVGELIDGIGGWQ